MARAGIGSRCIHIGCRQVGTGDEAQAGAFSGLYGAGGEGIVQSGADAAIDRQITGRPHRQIHRLPGRTCAQHQIVRDREVPLCANFGRTMHAGIGGRGQTGLSQYGGLAGCETGCRIDHFGQIQVGGGRCRRTQAGELGAGVDPHPLKLHAAGRQRYRRTAGKRQHLHARVLALRVPGLLGTHDDATVAGILCAVRHHRGGTHAHVGIGG